MYIYTIYTIHTYEYKYYKYNNTIYMNISSHETKKALSPFHHKKYFW